MARQRRDEDRLPPLFALVHPGLESVAADEITRDLGGMVRKTDRGVVIFRVPVLDESVLLLRTVEDVFLFAWGTDALTYRAVDLKSIQEWTESEVDWREMVRLHHMVHRKPKGRGTYRLVTQMIGEHVYRRMDAGKAMAKGLGGKLPPGWVPASENAGFEVWLNIRGSTAFCGVRLSERTMRHRAYKTEHMPASLRPSLAAAMVRLAGATPGQIVLDPMCGAGTLLAEQIELAKLRREGRITTWGGDLEPNALRAAVTNLQKVGPTPLAQWDATRLPLPSAAVDRVISNPPFGKQLSTPEEIGPLYQKMIRESNRVLKPGGKAVYLVSEPELLRSAIEPYGWYPERMLKVRILGQPAMIGVWQKPFA
ncbi:methyltransferase [Tuwongella immobilis]|uniref:Ribosomal RNA large subunit methyltransferase K/L-like methyltransferase domain-containing protein n=1 Tax=Tuwongella immobilis TaxID=692036 RepID=A0A6C2YQ36_9BACT|nr:methyltransferase [Tuwongella immobilis]VIP03586.1 rna methylase : RNA methylase OS=uncultured planctomycete GN=HGMM_F22C11C22 PE=4 SV=1: UPF0020 [Tuwongella immobilis]VTS04540.1 rna methylase : RNA methylase OS=uncultured planctomycete GN=HGMM_F22C11C22 PE=4 SV=1: UPF0020 [Tuwongella immobilis]